VCTVFITALNKMSQDNIVIVVVIRLQAGQSRVQIPAVAEDFFLLQNIQTSSAAHLLFGEYPVSSWESSIEGM